MVTDRLISFIHMLCADVYVKIILIAIGTYGIRKRTHIEIPEGTSGYSCVSLRFFLKHAHVHYSIRFCRVILGERPSQRTRKQQGSMGLSTAVPTKGPSTSSQPKCQTSRPAFVSTTFSANGVVPGIHMSPVLACIHWQMFAYIFQTSSLI